MKLLSRLIRNSLQRERLALGDQTVSSRLHPRNGAYCLSKYLPFSHSIFMRQIIGIERNLTVSPLPHHQASLFSYARTGRAYGSRTTAIRSIKSVYQTVQVTQTGRITCRESKCQNRAPGPTVKGHRPILPCSMSALAIDSLLYRPFSLQKSYNRPISRGHFSTIPLDIGYLPRPHYTYIAFLPL
jgi:hypothetical protein